MIKDQAWFIAPVAHDANRALRMSLGESPGPDWSRIAEGDRQALLHGIRKVLENPDITPEQLHEEWVNHRVKDGWTHGPVKDPDKRTHPMLVPYADLDPVQQAKDALLRSIVLTLAPIA